MVGERINVYFAKLTKNRIIEQAWRAMMSLDEIGYWSEIKLDAVVNHGKRGDS